jgi:hypothetical protein
MTEIEILKLHLQHYINQERQIIDMIKGDHEKSATGQVKKFLEKIPPKQTPQNLNYFGPSYPRFSKW